MHKVAFNIFNTRRGALYSGQARTGFSLRAKHGNIKEVPRLYDQCIQASLTSVVDPIMFLNNLSRLQVLKDNVDSIDETGNLPFDILKPVIKNVPREIPK